jgi:glycosyltransferase involved in cell wall biosynthesis
MRRLTVVQLLPALGNGGVERATLEIADALVRAGHRSIVVSAGGRLLPELLATGSEHVALPIGAKRPAVFATAPSLRRLLMREHVDIVHARSRLPAWIARLALRGLRDAPHFVTTVHGLNSPGRYSGVMTRGERVICVSETVRAHVLAQWPRTPPERLVVIERGLDARRFPRQLPRERDGGPVRLLLPGRGTRLKGHGEAVRLLAALRAAGCEATLELPGAREPGRERYVAELESLAAAAGIGDAVHLQPPRDDMAAAYRDCDLVLQLSTQPEAFGRTVVEALASGRPVVGWDIGGVGESLRRYFPAGRVPAGDRDALRDTTLSLLAVPAIVPPILAPTLADMQANTLKLYESLVA